MPGPAVNPSDSCSNRISLVRDPQGRMMKDTRDAEPDEKGGGLFSANRSMQKEVAFSHNTSTSRRISKLSKIQ